MSLTSSDGYVPMDADDIAVVLSVPEEESGLLEQALDTLISSGILARTKRGKLAAAAETGLISGTFRATTRGFGFVTPDPVSGKSAPDLYVTRENSLGALNGDHVQVKPIGPRTTGRHYDVKYEPRGKGKHRKNRAADKLLSVPEPEQTEEAVVTRVLERAVTEVIGKFCEIIERPPLPKGRRRTKKGAKLPRPTAHSLFIVHPDDPKLTFRIRIAPSMRGAAKDGDKVLVRLTKYPLPSKLNHHTAEGDAAGKVLRVFGDSESRGANYQAILYENGVRTVFDEDVLSEAERVAAEKIVPDGRLDLRDETIFTIDGPDAKDFDDAISLKRDGDGYLLGVHIADVSHYVKPGGALDREAFERGTSIYFADRVVPMLPEKLSDGVCSLNRDTDKYTLSALISLDADARIISVELREAIISSKVRGVYPEINDVLEKREGSEFWSKYAFLFPDTLPLMVELYEKLAKRSAERGALEMETAEAGFVLDASGMPVDVICRSRGVSEKMIEQFMLAANEAVAGWLNSLGMPCVYRVHDAPNAEKVQNFAVFAHGLGLDIRPLRRKNLDARAFREVYDEAREKGLDGVLSVILLRSLMKAKYSSVAAPHFGLGCELYCHFTSPIRRYPDLAVHRIVRAVLRGDINTTKFGDFAEKAAVKSSENELRALNAEREIEDLYKILYMSDKIGEEFEGVISSVNSFGFFVELPNTVEGLVPIVSLDGYFDYDERTMTLTCGKIVYRLGDTVRIRVVRCDTVTRRIDFEIC